MLIGRELHFGVLLEQVVVKENLNLQSFFSFIKRTWERIKFGFL